MPQARDNPLLEHEPFGEENSSFNTKPLQNLSDVESYESGSVPKRTEADKLEFERWPHVTRIRKWENKHAKREVIAGSTHPRTPAEWLAKIDQATSMQDLDNVGAVSDDDHMSCETVDSQTAKAP